MLTVQNIKYIHPDKELLFENISFSVQKQDKIALIGNNGTGKSTLLKIMAGILQPAQGAVKWESRPYYIPQHFGQYNGCTVAGALKIGEKLTALNEVLRGNATDENLSLLNEDWSIEERSREALSRWDLGSMPFTMKMSELSGGEKTKVFLAGISIHNPDIILMDEPTNHLDTVSREALYSFITRCSQTLVVVSHDRLLLELLNTVYELDKRGITAYGGNYNFYKEQKEIEENALRKQLEEKEKELNKAKKIERETKERRERLEGRGKKKLEKEGAPRIVIKNMKNKAEVSSARLREVHSGKIAAISGELSDVRKKLPGITKMKIDFESSTLHTGKILVTATDINFSYETGKVSDNHPGFEGNGFSQNHSKEYQLRINKLNAPALWKFPLNFQIRSGERISIAGRNGSGKTTLIRLILGELEPTEGVVKRAEFSSVYIDQDYSIINGNLSVYEQAESYNQGSLPEHEVKIRLNRFLFGKDFWDKPCNSLSGGEKMRLMLCCLMISNHSPDLFVLDEPTNNLDIENIEILTSAVNEYSGTLLVVSHDTLFKNEIGVERIIEVC
jgi:ATPase subunit of ABC transporter with duplicated ATPase domains